MSYQDNSGTKNILLSNNCLENCIIWLLISFLSQSMNKTKTWVEPRQPGPQFFCINKNPRCEVFSQPPVWLHARSLKPDMRKGADARTLSAEVLMDCGNIRHNSLDFIFISRRNWKSSWHHCLFIENIP